MRQVNELITQRPVGSGPTSPENGQSELERQKIESLWSLMSSMFGHRWTSSYGDEVDPDRAWQAALKGMTEAMVKQGLNRVAASGLEWPPSAPEFRAMCMDGYGTEETDWEQRRNEAAERERQKRLRLERKCTPEEFAKGSAVLKSLLSGVKTHG